MPMEECSGSTAMANSVAGSATVAEWAAIEVALAIAAEWVVVAELAIAVE